MKELDPGPGSGSGMTFLSRGDGEFFQKDSKELFLGLSDRNLRIYVAPVRNAEGTLIGYYERFELNLQKEA